MSATKPGFDARKVAIILRDTRARRERLEPLAADVAPRTVEEGAAAQLALAELGGNGSPAGFKIGATAKRMQEYLGLAGPAAGFMAKSGLHANGTVLRFADFVRPGIECEIVVKLAKDLPAGPCTAEQAAASVGEFTAAAAAGILSETDAMTLVRERGSAMASAAALEPTGMSAVIGAAEDELLARLAELGLEPANFNGGGQIVVAGELDALEKLRVAPPAGSRFSRPAATARRRSTAGAM